MANLTITVDDEVLKRARARALEQKTSVNAILSDYLSRFSGMRDTQQEALNELLTAASRSSADDKRRSSRRGGRSWRREDLYE